MQAGSTREIAMCESCGPSRPLIQTPEEKARSRALYAELSERLDRRLATQGLTRDQLLDPDCYGGPVKKARRRIAAGLANLGLLFGIG